MSVRDRMTDRYLVFSSEMLLSGWRNIKTGEENLVRNSTRLYNYAFSGIQIVEPKIFSLITETGKFSVIQLYLRLAVQHNIYGFQDQSSLWMDLGKPDQLAAAGKQI